MSKAKVRKTLKIGKARPTAVLEAAEADDASTPPESPSRRISEGTTTSSAWHLQPPNRRNDKVDNEKSKNEEARRLPAVYVINNGSPDIKQKQVLSKTGKGIILDDACLPTVSEKGNYKYTEQNGDLSSSSKSEPSSLSSTASSASLPLPQPSLSRSRAGIPSAARPGALAVNGFQYHNGADSEQSNEYDNILDENVVDQETNNTNTSRLNDDYSSSVLVTAELVTPPCKTANTVDDIERGSPPFSADVEAPANKSTTPELVKAEPMVGGNVYKESDYGQLQMKDLWKNRKTRLLLVIICLVIVALIVGIVTVVLVGGKNDSLTVGTSSNAINYNLGVSGTSGSSATDAFLETEIDNSSDNDDD